MKTKINLLACIAICVTLILAGCAASKVKVDPYVGEWHYTFPTQDGGEMAAVMTITKLEKGYSGTLSSDMGSVDLEDLVLSDGKMSTKFEVQGYEITMKGTFEGDTYNGMTNFDGNEFPMKATRQASGQ